MKHQESILKSLECLSHLKETPKMVIKPSQPQYERNIQQAMGACCIFLALEVRTLTDSATEYGLEPTRPTPYFGDFDFRFVDALF